MSLAAADDHFEIPYDDAERAKSFYREALGWQIEDLADHDYTMVMTGPRDEQGMPTEPNYIGGGMTPRTQSTNKSPVITIDVPDIDAALENLVRLGGSVVSPKMVVGEMGFGAYFADSEGNVMGLWETAQAS